jgi:hypothetical protein
VLTASVHDWVKGGDVFTDDLGAQDLQGLEGVVGGHGSMFVVDDLIIQEERALENTNVHCPSRNVHHNNTRLLGSVFVVRIREPSVAAIV